MSKYYVDSFAYDYDMFMPHEKKQNNVVEINRKRSNNAAPRRNSKPRAFSAGSLVKVAFVAVMLGLIVGNIYLRGQVTEVTSKINKVQTEYNRALAENVSLEMQLESSVSYKNLVQSAKSLGMQKAEPYQINYINSVGGYKIEITDGNNLVTAQTGDSK